MAVGWFWHPEKFFSEMKGVAKTIVGYSGGKTKFPNYQ